MDENDFFLTALRFYDNAQCVNTKEFEADLKRFIYLKKLFSKYKVHNILKERLILNHIIILHNLFGVALIEMLFFKIPKCYWADLITFLVFLNLMPETVPTFNVITREIELNQSILSVLKELL